MVKSELLGPFPLTQENITENVVEADHQWSAGAFALGRLDEGRFFVRRTGRSDTDMAAKLVEYIGHYDAFKFRTYASTRRAYEKECRLFHDFKPNNYHLLLSMGIKRFLPICLTGIQLKLLEHGLNLWHLAYIDISLQMIFGLSNVVNLVTEMYAPIH